MRLSGSTGRELVERERDLIFCSKDPDVRLCLDTEHHILGSADPLEVARLFADRIAHVHFERFRRLVAERLREARVLLEARRVCV